MRIVVMREGRIVADASPRDILVNEDLLKSARLEAPPLTKLFCGMARDEVGQISITIGEAREMLHGWRSSQP